MARNERRHPHAALKGVRRSVTCPKCDRRWDFVLFERHTQRGTRHPQPLGARHARLVRIDTFSRY